MVNTAEECTIHICVERLKIKPAWWVRKHETQSCSESCVLSFSNPLLIIIIIIIIIDFINVSMSLALSC